MKTNYKADESKRQAGFRETLMDGANAPSDALGKKHAYLLAIGHEQANLNPSISEHARRFFAEREIHWWRSPVSGDPPHQNGPTRNMLSSQCACLNFLMPLCTSRDALTAFLRGIDPTVASVEPIPPVAGSSLPPSLLEFEWCGFDGNLEGTADSRGANSTSADVFMLGRLADGSIRAFVIEWKYTESYPNASFKGDGESGQTRLSRYTGRFTAPDSSFRGGIPMTDLLYEPFYQIMRFFLLRDELIRKSGTSLRIASGMVAVVCPAANRAYRETVTPPALSGTKTVQEATHSVLRRPEDFIVVAPEVLAARISAAVPTREVTEWHKYLSQRYGW